MSILRIYYAPEYSDPLFVIETEEGSLKLTKPMAKALAGIMMSGTRSVDNGQGFSPVFLRFKQDGNIEVDVETESPA